MAILKLNNRVLRIINPGKAKHKGHEIILKYKSLISNELNKQDVIVEIGSDREAGSTRVLAQLALYNGVQFITVDVDEQTSQRADAIVKEIDPSFRAVNDYGEKYLAKINQPLKLVYLDAFDLPGDWHPSEVIEKYRQKNMDLTLENCYKMHLDCAKTIITKAPKGAFVCFDDVNPVDLKGDLLFRKVGKLHMEWSGKGKTAIPFLIENGFEIIDNLRACVLLRKVNDKLISS